ncbi:MAG: T9SS type A sorting domain-containing protein [Ignavibacteriaceae bacterium]
MNLSKTSLFIIPVILLTILLGEATFATIRYVSKTGTSEPPYTKWEIASDSIQKCLDICSDGDTVIVANGVYKECLVINAAITLIGSSMDSCVIDSRGMSPSTYATIRIFKETSIIGFEIIGYGIIQNPQSEIVSSRRINFNIKNCKLSNCSSALYLSNSSGSIENVFIFSTDNAIYSFCMSDTCKPKLLNSVIIIPLQSSKSAFTIGDGGRPTIVGNIFYTDKSDIQPNEAITYVWHGQKSIIIKNNLFYGFQTGCDFPEDSNPDTSLVENNVFTYTHHYFQNTGALSYPNNNTYIRNNIFAKNQTYGIKSRANNLVKHNNNLYWENKYNVSPEMSLGPTDIVDYPMFVKDTTYQMGADFHLQMYSPAIDKGDSTILDVDGSRSDIGMYGGPLGQSYQYLDLPPNPPRNIQYIANINEKKITFTWKKNSESDFKEYHVFRDTVQGFTPDSAHFYLILPDSTLGDTAQFIDTYSGENAKYYYRIIAEDNQGNESSPSDEISVIITGVDIMDVEIVTDYRLYQNYPNPFNPNTVIGYQLAQSSYVKVMLYDIKGELLEFMVNENKPAGYYEVEFNAGKYASGIYLYRIETVDEAGIPRFMDMKKMMLVK